MVQTKTRTVRTTVLEITKGRKYENFLVFCRPLCYFAHFKRVIADDFRGGIDRSLFIEYIEFEIKMIISESNLCCCTYLS